MESIIEKTEKKSSPTGFFKIKTVANGSNDLLKYDSTVEILLLLRKKMKMLLLAGLSVFVLTFFIYYELNNYYLSSVVFLIDDSDPSEVSASEPERLVLSQMNAQSKNKLSLLVFSDEMILRLEKEINLAGHYHISTGNPYYRKDVLEVLRKYVVFKKNELNTITIEVIDKDRVFASELANAIFNNLVNLNRETVLNNVRYKLSIYENNIGKEKIKKEEDMNKFIHALYQLPNLNKSTIKDPDAMFFLKRDLNNMFTEYNNSSANLSRNELIFNLNTDVLRDTSLKSLFLINKAYPNSMEVNYLKATGISLFAALTIVLYFFFTIYLVKRYKPYIQILYKKELPRFYH